MKTTPIEYDHRQTGWPILPTAFLTVAGAAAIVATMPGTRRAIHAPALFIVAAILLVGFSSLSVTVTAERLVARFGIGLVRRTILLADIVDVGVERTRWYEGWGIHITRRGMLYNVAGFDAVALRLSSGRTVRVGSDDAQRLAATLRRAIDDRRAHRPPTA